MIKKVQAPRKKKSKPAKKTKVSRTRAKKPGNFFRGVTKFMPDLRPYINPLLSKGHEKLGDAYASVARVIATQKEALEDHLAERKNRSRTARQKRVK